MKNIAIYILSGLILISCGGTRSSNEGTLPVIDIELGLKAIGKTNLSDYALNIEYIPLCIDMDVLVGDFNRFTFKKQADCYYYGCLANKSCLVFSNDGKYVGRIGQQGKAGNEYYTILDMEINPLNKDLVVYDGKKLVVYTNTGDYKNTIHLDNINREGNLAIRDFNMIGEYICLHVMNTISDMPGVIFLDTNGKQVMADLSQQTKKRQTEFESTEGVRYRKRTALNSYLWNNQLTIVNPVSDTLFAYTPELQKVSRYVLDFGKYKLLPNRSNQPQSITINPNIVYESDNILILSILTNNNKFDCYMPGLGYLLYDKKRRDTHILPYYKAASLFGFYNDLDNGAPFQPEGIYGNQLYQTVSALQFIENSKIYNSPKMRELAAKLTENSNPVVILVTLK